MGYEPVALKRKWIPETVFSIAARMHLVMIYPFRWVLMTSDPKKMQSIMLDDMLRRAIIEIVNMQDDIIDAWDAAISEFCVPQNLTEEYQKQERFKNAVKVMRDSL